jgi:putative flippase GtrA
MIKTFFQLVRYVLVGAAATVFDLGAYYIFTRFLFLAAEIANPLSYLTGNIISFLGQRTITFHSNGRPGPQYFRFLVVSAIGLGISQTTLLVGLHFGLHDLVAKVACVITSGGFNYLANRFWTFKATEYRSR